MWIVVSYLMSILLKKLKRIFRKLIFHLHFSLFYVGFLLVLIIWPFPILNGRTVDNLRTWSGYLNHIMSMFFRIKWEVRNSEVLAKDRGAVIVANHQSSLDIVGIFQVWQTANKMTVVAKKTVLYAGPLGIVAYFGGSIFIDRMNPKSAYKQLQATSKVIKEKVKIWMFPEGTRNFDQPELLPFKKGAFSIAVAAQAPIIPLVYSPYYFVDRKNYRFNKGRVIIQCLEEIPTEGLTMDDVPELTERVRDIMQAAYKKLSDEVVPTTSSYGLKEDHVKL